MGNNRNNHGNRGNAATVDPPVETEAPAEATPQVAPEVTPNPETAPSEGATTPQTPEEQAAAAKAQTALIITECEAYACLLDEKIRAEEVLKAVKARLSDAEIELVLKSKDWTGASVKKNAIVGMDIPGLDGRNCVLYITGRLSQRGFTDTRRAAQMAAGSTSA